MLDQIRERHSYPKETEQLPDLEDFLVTYYHFCAIWMTSNWGSLNWAVLYVARGTPWRYGQFIMIESAALFDRVLKEIY